MGRFFNVLTKVECFLAALFMGAFSVLGFVQVVARNMGSPIPWTEEACRFLFVWSSFIGAVLVMANNGHFKVELIPQLLPKRARFVFSFISYICIGIFSYIMIRYGIDFVLVGARRVSPTMQVNMGYIFLILPLSGALCMIHLVGLIINDIKEMGRARSLNKGGTE